ncbi:hypothetical protein PFLUV_G00210300 [Perca fluviatilis]|uniref:Uncharacterized protein n=1 Tax=Perca fluviatilis TaxID=8168 RepID=A0A6A5EQJ1_PERFL|nr:hypothetical protein PFLUV_G00210300 [Perca fluviatilis]
MEPAWADIDTLREEIARRLMVDSENLNELCHCCGEINTGESDTLEAPMDHWNVPMWMRTFGVLHAHHQHKCS